MISFIVFFVLGCVKIRILGNAAEFMTFVFGKKYKFKTAKKSDNVFVFLKKDFEKCREFTKSNGIGMEIISEKGIPFIFGKYGKRAGIYIGVLLFAAIVSLSGKVVWHMEVSGNEKVNDMQILENLRELGFTYGTFIDKTDFDNLRRDYLIANDDLCWISVNMKGTYANIEVRELEKGADSAGDGLCNIVAAENGKIVIVEVEEGKACVGVGDKVSKGDLLIGCVMTSGEDRLRFERAKGNVIAEVVRNFSYTVPFEKTVYEPSGKENCEKELIFFKKNIKISENGGIRYKFCDTIEKEKYVHIQNGLRIPVGLRSVTCRELLKKTVELCESDAKAEADKVFDDYLSDCLDGAEILSYGRCDEVSSDGYTVSCEVVCLCDIGIGTEVGSDIGK